MPVWSPNGKKLVYVKEVNHGLSLWLSDIEGNNSRSLTSDGINLLPSWLPDSRHIVWMKTVRAKAKPTDNSQLYIMDTKTGNSRRLFSDEDQLKFSNAMPSVSPNGRKIAFVSNRSGTFRVWVSQLDGSESS